MLTLSILLLACAKDAALVDSAPVPMVAVPEEPVDCDNAAPQAKATWTVERRAPFVDPQWTLALEAWDADGDLDAWTMHAWLDHDPDAVIDTSREPDWTAVGGQRSHCNAFEVSAVGGSGPVEINGPYYPTSIFYTGNRFAAAIAIIDAHGVRSEPYHLVAEIPEGL